jgi:hypothetical protein
MSEELVSRLRRLDTCAVSDGPVGNIRVKSAHSALNLLDDSAPEESLTCPFEHSGTTRTLISPANLPESTHQSAQIHLRWK